jgi:hypothetical protein
MQKGVRLDVVGVEILMRYDFTKQAAFIGVVFCIKGYFTLWMAYIRGVFVWDVGLDLTSGYPAEFQNIN